MACDHLTLSIEEREIHKDGIHVADVDIVICPACKIFTLARMKRKDLKKAKKTVAAKTILKANPAKVQAPVKPKQQPAKAIGTQPVQSYGANNNPKPTGVNSNPKQPVNTPPNSTPQNSTAVKSQGINPLKTESIKSKKK